MLLDEEQGSSRIFACPQCPKIFATRSNLKRHMENPNIHNIPYVRSRDQKRWKGHSKKVISKEETTESNNDRMRKWRAENREKNRQNDLRCRVYRLARQKYGESDSAEKQGFVREEIARRLGRRMMMEHREDHERSWSPASIRMMSPVHFTTPPSTPLLTSTLLSPLTDLIELPFYSAPQQKIELPSLANFSSKSWSSSSPSDFTSSSANSSPRMPHLSPQRRTSNSSLSSLNSVTSDSKQMMKSRRSSIALTAATAALEEKRRSLSVNTTPIPTPSTLLFTPTSMTTEEDAFCVLPSMHAILSCTTSAEDKQTSSCRIPTITTKGGIKYVDSSKILDEFVGVVLNYVDNNAAVAQ